MYSRNQDTDCIFSNALDWLYCNPRRGSDLVVSKLSPDVLLAPLVDHDEGGMLGVLAAQPLQSLLSPPLLLSLCRSTRHSILLLLNNIFVFIFVLKNWSHLIWISDIAAFLSRAWPFVLSLLLRVIQKMLFYTVFGTFLFYFYFFCGFPYLLKCVLYFQNLGWLFCMKC